VHVGYDIFLSTNGKEDLPKLIHINKPQWEHSRVIWEWDPRGFDPATDGILDRPPGGRKGTDHRTERNFPTHLLDRRTIGPAPDT
jgi:hypothetical protein